MPARKKVLKSFVTTLEAAHLLGVSLRTVQLWAENGLLACWKTEGGHRRIPRESVERLLANRIAPESAAVGEEASASATSGPGGDRPLNILVVEDEPTLLRLYRMQLARWALRPEVRTARNGFEALLQVGKSRPDLLVADLYMPEMDGFQMLRTLRTLPELDAMEIVVVSGLDPAAIEQRGGLPEGIPVLPKPIPFGEIEKIAEGLARELGRGPNPSPRG